MRSVALSHNGSRPSNAHQIARFLRRPRLVGAVLFTLVVFIALLPLMQLSRAMLIAFDPGAVVFLSLMAFLMVRATAQSMKHRAQIQDEGRWTMLVMSLR